VFCGEWNIGRIYEFEAVPTGLRWFWSMTVNGAMTRSDRVATLEETKVQFGAKLGSLEAWAELEQA
jgi:hypothetical protein